MSGDGQARLIAWLRTPAAHGGRGPVEHIETHISHVFLAGDRALKLKKAIRPAFLDYSTVGKRQAAALAELAINRRTAPALYLDVVPVRADATGFHLGGGRGRIVDWLVRMRSFDQADLLDRMARERRLEATHVAALADAVAQLHAVAERRSDQGGTAGMHWHFTVPLEALEGMESCPFSEAALKRMRGRLEAEWRRLAPLLEARRRHGFVRHGHGDLHLGNACLFRGKVTLFDAVEFSDRIACVDILYDAAFMVMDLVAHGRRDFATLFLSRYLEATRDYGGLGAMPFFIAIRALVRAMANALSRTASGEAHARRYFALAEQALERPPVPQLVAVGGLSGTGKSRLARALLVHLPALPGAVHIRSDGIRKRLFGRCPEERLPASAYSRDWHRRTYDRLHRDVRRALAAGWPVVADATFIDVNSRARIAALADHLGVPFAGLWLEAPADILRARIRGRGPDASDADLAVLEAQLARDVGPLDWNRIDAGEAPERVASRALDAIGVGERP